MVSSFSDLTARCPHLLWILGGASFLTFTGTLLFLPLVLVRIPPDYFVRPRKSGNTSSRPVMRTLRILILILKNMLGAVLLLLGLIMLFTPGQGLLTVLAGILMMNFPGKRKLEIRLISRDSIFNGINRIRRRVGREPLIRPPKEPPHRKAI